MKKATTYASVDGMLTEAAKDEKEAAEFCPTASQNPSVMTACFQHSGIKAAIRFLAKDSEAQWEAIHTISNRMWAILIGVCGTFFLVLIQLLYYHAKP